MLKVTMTLTALLGSVAALSLAPQTATALWPADAVNAASATLPGTQSSGLNQLVTPSDQPTLEDPFNEGANQSLAAPLEGEPPAVVGPTSPSGQITPTPTVDGPPAPPPAKRPARVPTVTPTSPEVSTPPIRTPRVVVRNRPTVVTRSDPPATVGPAVGPGVSTPPVRTGPVVARNRPTVVVAPNDPPAVGPTVTPNDPGTFTERRFVRDGRGGHWEQHVIRIEPAGRPRGRVIKRPPA